MNEGYVNALKGLLNDFIGYREPSIVTTRKKLEKYFRKNYKKFNLDINDDFSAVVIDAIMMLGQEARLQRMGLGQFKLMPEQDSFVPRLAEQRICSAYFCNNDAKFVSTVDAKLVYCSRKCNK